MSYNMIHLIRMTYFCATYYIIWYVKRPMNYLSIGGKSVIKNDQSKLTRWDVIIYDMEVPGKPFKEFRYKITQKLVS